MNEVINKYTTTFYPLTSHSVESKHKYCFWRLCSVFSLSLRRHITSITMHLWEIGRKEGDDRKMGSPTENTNTDCHQEQEQDQHHPHRHHHERYDDEHEINNRRDLHDDDVNHNSSSSAAGPCSTSYYSQCPLRRRINDDQDEEDEDHNRSSCESNCPSNYRRGGGTCSPSYLVPRNNSVSSRNCDSHEDLSSCSSSFNENNCVRSRSRSRNDEEDDDVCTTSRRIRRRSTSLLTSPCALYLFAVLVILDWSDLRSSLYSSSDVVSRTNSELYASNGGVTTMRRIGFLVNAAFNNKNGQYGLGGGGGLTAAGVASPEVPILSMDSVFFDDSSSFGNQLTGSSESGEEAGENFSGEEEEGEDDDGKHVEISRTVEPQMLKRLESQFLKLFGMAKRPQSAQKKQIKIPKYLLDLYQKQTGTELPTSNLNLPGRHTRTANTVRTFYHQPGNPKEASYAWRGRENHIKFNVNSIPEVEKVTGAELRIPFTITVSADNSVTVNSEPLRESNDGGESSSAAGGQVHNEPSQLKAVRILLHDVTKPATSPKSRKPKETHLLEPITYPIDSKTVVLSKRRNGTSTFWLTFDVFPAVARWMSNPKKNHGLVLEILGVTNEGHMVPQETVVERHNLRVKRDVDDEKSTSGFGDEEGRKSGGGGGSHTNSITTESSLSAAGSSSKSTQDSGESSFSSRETPTSSSSVVSSSSPTEVGVATDGFISSNEKTQSVDTASSIVLFTYSDDGHNPTKTRDAKTLSRHYRSAQNQQRRRKNHRNKNRKRNLCQRHAMFVDFQDVGWNDWIVAPPGYAAYYCSGECPFPMAEHLNATNHAVIQALVHSVNPAQVPPPCCVPTKYSSLSLLYTDSSDKIVLKNYNEMVVDSCGCS